MTSEQRKEIFHRLLWLMIPGMLSGVIAGGFTGGIVYGTFKTEIRYITRDVIDLRDETRRQDTAIQENRSLIYRHWRSE